MSNHLLRLACLAFSMLLIQSCILEERFLIREDMSGTYQMTLNFSALIQGEDEADIELIDGMREIMDSMALAFDTLPGISGLRPLMTDTTMEIGFSFEDLFEVEKLSMNSDEETPVPIFKRKGKRFIYTPDVESSLSAMSPEDEGDAEVVEKETKDDEDAMDEYFRVRTIITFEGDVKPKKMDHFRREGKNTFIYDSADEGLEVQPLLEVKF